jgi:hypothetical protein
MEPFNPQQAEARAEARHKVFLILWFALFVSVMLLLVLVLVAGSKGHAKSYAELCATRHRIDDRPRFFSAETAVGAEGHQQQ